MHMAPRMLLPLVLIIFYSQTYIAALAEQGTPYAHAPAKRKLQIALNEDSVVARRTKRTAQVSKSQQCKAKQCRAR